MNRRVLASGLPATVSRGTLHCVRNQDVGVGNQTRTYRSAHVALSAWRDPSSFGGCSARASGTLAVLRADRPLGQPRPTPVASANRYCRQPCHLPCRVAVRQPPGRVPRERHLQSFLSGKSPLFRSGNRRCRVRGHPRSLECCGNCQRLGKPGPAALVLARAGDRRDLAAVAPGPRL